MPPRANWKGYLKLSLVSCPVALFPAASASEKVSFHLLNEATGNRLKQQYVDAETGAVVEREELVKGYEVAKGDYVTVSDEELAAIDPSATQRPPGRRGRPTRQALKRLRCSAPGRRRQA